MRSLRLSLGYQNANKTNIISSITAATTATSDAEQDRGVRESDEYTVIQRSV